MLSIGCPSVRPDYSQPRNRLPEIALPTPPVWILPAPRPSPCPAYWARRCWTNILQLTCSRLILDNIWQAALLRCTISCVKESRCLIFYTFYVNCFTLLQFMFSTISFFIYLSLVISNIIFCVFYVSSLSLVFFQVRYRLSSSASSRSSWLTEPIRAEMEGAVSAC
jgi:hypothetical protein